MGNIPFVRNCCSCACCRRRRNPDVHLGSFFTCEEGSLVNNQSLASDAAFHSFAGSNQSALREEVQEGRRVLHDARGSRSSMMIAYESFTRQLETDPSNTYLKIACAEAIVSVMRIVGHANALTCHFKEGSAKPEIRTSDTTDNQAAWSELTPSAQRLLNDVEADLGIDVFNKQGALSALSLEALMYAVASRGILTASLSGCAPAFLLRLTKFSKLHPQWDSCQYCIYWGAYYLAAPWPARNVEKARRFFELSAQQAPHSRRNQYFVGVGRFASEDFRGAREAMERSLQEPSPTETELDIREFLDAEATRTAQMLKEKGY